MSVSLYKIHRSLGSLSAGRCNSRPLLAAPSKKILFSLKALIVNSIVPSTLWFSLMPFLLCRGLGICMYFWLLDWWFLNYGSVNNLSVAGVARPLALPVSGSNLFLEGRGGRSRDILVFHFVWLRVSQPCFLRSRHNLISKRSLRSMQVLPPSCNCWLTTISVAEAIVFSHGCVCSTNPPFVTSQNVQNLSFNRVRHNMDFNDSSGTSRRSSGRYLPG